MILSDDFGKIRVAAPMGSQQPRGVEEWLRMHIPDLEEFIDKAQGLMAKSMTVLKSGGEFPTTEIQTAISWLHQTHEWVRNSGYYTGPKKSEQYGQQLISIMRALSNIKLKLKGAESYWDWHKQTNPEYVVDYLQDCINLLQEVVDNHSVFSEYDPGVT